MAQEVNLDLTATDKASAEIKKVTGEIKEAKEEQGLFADQTNRLKTSFSKLKGGCTCYCFWYSYNILLEI